MDAQLEPEATKLPRREEAWAPLCPRAGLLRAPVMPGMPEPVSASPDTSQTQETLGVSPPPHGPGAGLFTEEFRGLSWVHSGQKMLQSISLLVFSRDFRFPSPGSIPFCFLGC